MKKIIVIFLLAAVLFSSGCVSQEGSSGGTDPAAGSTGNDISYSSNIEKVEVLHFHGHNQCYSCVTLGDYAEETVNTYFAEEMKSGKVVFGHINGELVENRDLVMKYEATGSSLWIGVYDKNGSFSKEQNIKVWYKLNDKKGFMEYLKGVIEEKLQGE